MMIVTSLLPGFQKILPILAGKARRFLASLLEPSMNVFVGAARRRTDSWFPGSAWEPTALEALPPEAEPRAQCVPRQSLGTRCAEEVSRDPGPRHFNPA